MKVDAKIFKGIEYVQVSELPQIQREMLAKTIDPDRFIKLLIDGKIVSGCLQYKDYTSWYQDQFLVTIDTAKEGTVVTPIEIKTNLALNKA